VLATTTIHALFIVTAARRAQHRSVWPPLLLIIILAATSTGAIGWLSYHSLSSRIAETRQALDQSESVFGGREALYRDTWTLAAKQPVFGWGLDTYAVGFQMIRPYTVNLRDRSENLFATAHSDWLQSLTETGFVGTTLVLLMVLLPLSTMPRRLWSHPLTCYPIFGCALVTAYAGVEFPFANAAVLISITTLFFTTLRLTQLTDHTSRTRHE
jgi:O-antigen ligase